MLPLLGKKDDEVVLDGVSLDQVAREFGTPLFVFSGGALRDRVSAFRTAFNSEWPRFQLMPSLKACPILAIRQLLTELDCGCDVFGPGELEGALRAGVEPSRISVNGSIKDESIVRRALAVGARIVIDSPREASLINALADELSEEAAVLLRLKPLMPDLNAASDFAPEMQIGELTQRIKYGIPNSELHNIVDAWPSFSSLTCVGFHAHMGRHSKRLEVWSAWAEAVATQVSSLQHLVADCVHPVINMGGGLASERDADLDVIYRDDRTPSLKEWAEVICGALRSNLADSDRAWSDWILELEPGRGLHSDSGLHLTTVKNLKHEKSGREQRWAEVDTSEVFLDLHGVPDNCPLEVLAVKKSSDNRVMTYDVVGLTCNAEMLMLDVQLPELTEGDVLAFLPTGAYLEPMAANFNALPRPGAVLIDNGVACLIKRHETVEDVFSRDII
jgi:diaminopimelate decarboxylase